MRVRSSSVDTEAGPPSRRGTPRPSPQALAIPIADAVALLAAVAVGGRWSALAVAYGALTFTALLITGSQRIRLNATLGCDVPWLLARLAVPLLLLVAGAAPVLGPGAAPLSRLVATASVAAILVPLERAVVYAAVRGARRRGRLLGRVLIVGAGEVGVELAKVLRDHPEYGLVPVGFVDTVGVVDGSGNAGRDAAANGNGNGNLRGALPVLADARALGSVVERERVTSVVIAFGAMGEAELARTMRTCEALPVEVYVVPRLFDFGIAPAGLLADDIWGIPLIRLRRPALRRAARVTKRLFDIVCAGAALLVCAPVLLAAAVAVRRSSPGPVLFRQLRVGRDGAPFELLKFRTMVVNDDADTTWSVDGDERVTRVGQFLRRRFLDELPQLLNVLRGEMSLVGPRPERPYFVHRFAGNVPRYDDRHRVPAGMTGWAQVHGLRGDTPIHDRVRFDNYYIEHWSLWFDLVVLARTVAWLVTRRR
jgi:exopolysaccharide biosynthesis polyprenyl glycosylphosphotransferase